MKALRVGDTVTVGGAGPFVVESVEPAMMGNMECADNYWRGRIVLATHRSIEGQVASWVLARECEFALCRGGATA